MALSTVPQDTRIVLTNEKVTGPPAREMIQLLGIDDNSTVLDNATGGGVAALASKAKYATDINDEMLAFAASRGLNTLKADQADVPLESASFTHITNAFGIFFSPDEQAVLKETLRLLKPKGAAGFTSWKKISWWSELYTEMPLPLPDPQKMFPGGWNDAGAIQEKLTRAGFENVRVVEYTFQPRVEIEEFAEATAVLIKVVAKRAWSEEEFAKYSPGIESRILEVLRANHGDIWDGSMTALISCGSKPE